MDKLTMAHQYFLQVHKFVTENNIQHNYKELVKESWDYVSDMQAEADKRLNSDVEATDASEWQPDWSQAPEWAGWWAMDKNLEARWILSKGGDPYIGWCETRWFAIGVFDSNPASSFLYTGSWQDSLRKRPD